jgi:uncharacterized DUF497 family protein
LGVMTLRFLKVEQAAAAANAHLGPTAPDSRWVYTFVMQFEYDERKNAVNVAKHGIDLADAAWVFADPMRLDAVDQRREYGEPRRVVVGAVLGRVWVVVYTLRGEAVRLISARKANEREQKRYQDLRA